MLKKADSALLSLVMRTNGKCNNSHAHSGILLSFRPNIHKGPEYKKNINTTSSEKERTYSVRQQYICIVCNKAYQNLYFMVI